MRYFTPESANRTLPLVRRITADLIELQLDVSVRGERIDFLVQSHRGLAATSAHSEELDEMRDSLQADQGRLSEIEQELADLGVIIHSPSEGAVDFPARLNTTDVRLCWMPGDDYVDHWHMPGASTSDRKPIGDLTFDEVSNISAPTSSPDDPDNGSETGPRQSMRS